MRHPPFSLSPPGRPRRALLCLALLGGAASAQHEFASWTGYDLGFYPLAFYAHAAEAGDLDGDGDLDVVTAMGFNSGWVTVTRNRGDGSYEPPAWTALPQLSEGVALLDVDRDGDLDVVASQGGSSGGGGSVALLRNQGSGTLAPPQMIAAGAAGPAGLAVADFDGDGWLDVAAALYGFFGQGQHVSVLYGDGAGGLLPGIALTVPKPASASGPYRVTAGDLDGDGLPDLLAALDGNAVVTLLNTGARSFGSPTLHLAAPGPAINLGIFADAGLADADHDGDPDVFYSCTNSGFWSDTDVGAVILLRNGGSGDLGPPERVDLPLFKGAPFELEVADVTGDGWTDLVTVHGASGGWVFVRGDGAGGFLPGVELAAGEYANSAIIADADGNAVPDVLVTGRNMELTVHPWGEGPGGGFHLKQPAAVEPLSGDMDAADMDADGDLDVATSWEYAGGGGLSVLRNQGDGSFAPYVHYAGPRAAQDVKFRDLDGDADPDLLWATGNTGPPYDFHVRLNDGAGNFGPAKTQPVGTCGNGGIDAFDMDHDGDLDVFLCDALGCAGGGTSSFVWVSRNRGNATFDPPYALAFLLDPQLVDHGDFNADGHMDVIVTLADLVGVRLGHGDGTFGGPIYSQTPWGPTGLFVGRLDGDGFPDVATANMAGDPQQNMAVLIGRGDGSFKPPATSVVSLSTDFSGPVAIEGLDGEGDGDTDLVVANYGSGDASYFRNKGPGSFEPHVRFGLGEVPVDIATGDFDGDGRPDIAANVHKEPYALDRGITVVRGTGRSDAPWVNLGQGLAGSAGVPVLGGGGDLLPQTSLILKVAGARSSASGLLVLGLSTLGAPLKGGVLVPAADLVTGFATGAAGSFQVVTTVPAGIPAGQTLTLQAWLVDAAAPQGFSATNALQVQFP